MKLKLAIASLLVGVGVLPAQLAPSPATSTVSLAWTASVSPGVTNYSLWYGTNSGVYSTGLLAGTNLTLTVSNLTRGQAYYFAATCTITNGMTSAYSTEATYTPSLLPPAPGGFHLLILQP